MYCVYILLWFKNNWISKLVGWEKYKHETVLPIDICSLLTQGPQGWEIQHWHPLVATNLRRNTIPAIIQLLLLEDTSTSPLLHGQNGHSFAKGIANKNWIPTGTKNFFYQPYPWTPKPWKVKVLNPQYMGHNL